MRFIRDPATDKSGSWINPQSEWDAQLFELVPYLGGEHAFITTRFHYFTNQRLAEPIAVQRRCMDVIDAGRLREAPTTMRICVGWLFSPTVSPLASMSKPNLVQTSTWSRTGWRASPTRSSFVHGP